jgi:8-oxo-dGTP diphosphatase/2-hydroxy-dATP diphosphatase
MKPRWYDINDIPFDEMWPDDSHWMPLFLSGKKFKGRFLFGANDVILEKELNEVEDI